MSMSSQAGADTPDRQTSTQATNTGLDENVAAALSYALGWLTGIIMYIVESDNESVRFHAAQSIVVFGGYTILLIAIGVLQSAIAGLVYAGGAGFGMVFGFLSTVIGLFSLIVWVLGLALWVYLLIRTYQGEEPRVPGAVGLAKSIT